MDVAILTPLELEYAAVRPHLKGIRERAVKGFAYEVGAFGDCSVAICKCGSKNAVAAAATERIIQHFNPAVILLVGIAGGVKDVRIGDVAIGTRAYGYESGKVTPAGTVSRPDAIPFSRELIRKAESVSRQGAWLQRLDSGAVPRVVFGPIASGDKVIASTASPEFLFLKTHYNDTTALEMESIGFAQAAFNYPHIQALNIRGISDLLDGKNAGDDQNHQPMAAAHAAAFAFELISRLEFPENLPAMDVKTIVQKTLDALFPALDLGAAHNPGREFRSPPPPAIREIWEKVGPLFAEQIRNAGDGLDDEDTLQDVQAAIRMNLRRELANAPRLQEQLAALLQKAEEKGAAGSSVSVANSKNIIQGSNIQVGGDFRLGDDAPGS